MGALGWLLNLGFGGSAGAATLNVWVEQDTIRYKRTQAAGSGTTANLKIAKNETRGFCVLVRADGAINNIDLAVNSITGPATFATSNVWFYRAHQVEVVQSTWTNNNDAAGVDGTGWYPDALIPTRHPVTGDDLPAGKTYQAFPYNLPASQTHTFYVEIKVPKNTTAGDYVCTITLSADGQSDVTITANFTVYNFTLSDVPAMRNVLFKPGTVIWTHASASSTNPVGGYSPWNTLTQAQWDGDADANTPDHLSVEDTVLHVCNTTVKEHGWAPLETRVADSYYFRPLKNGTWSINDTRVTELQTMLDLYEPNLFIVKEPWREDSPVITDPDSDNGVDYSNWLQAYCTGIAKLARGWSIGCCWIYDEPFTDTKSDEVVKWGPALVTHPRTYSMITHPDTQVDTEDVDDLEAGTEWWIIPYKHYNATKALAIKNRGEDLGLYVASSGNTNSPACAYLHIDRPLLNYRLPGWFNFWTGGNSFLYWAGGVRWWEVMKASGDIWDQPATHTKTAITGTVTATNGSTTVTGSGTSFTTEIDEYIGINDDDTYDMDEMAIHRVASIQSDTELTLESAYQGSTGSGKLANRYVYNGEGVLFYPATDATIGFNGIVSTLRAKAFRDSVNDFEYMTKAAGYGYQKEVGDLVRSLITSLSSWDSTAANYDTTLATIAGYCETGEGAARTDAAAVGMIHPVGMARGEVHSTGSVAAMIDAIGAERLEVAV